MQDGDEFWNNALSAFESDPGKAIVMAQNLAALRDMIAEGETGIREAIEILTDGIAELYPHTEFNQACVKLYHRYISKDGLPPKFDPLMLVDDLDDPEPKRKPSKTKRTANKKKFSLKVA